MNIYESFGIYRITNLQNGEVVVVKIGDKAIKLKLD